MQITTLPYRTAIVTALNNVVYQTKRIPVYEEYLQPTESNKIAMLSGSVEAYIILLNQTSNNNSPKCHRNNEDSIQIQITTVFPAGKGGSKIAEEISNVVLGILFPLEHYKSNISIENMDVWKSELIGSRNINYNLNASRVWITQLTLVSNISQG